MLPPGDGDEAPERWARPIGWQLRYRAVTGSTNDDAKEAALAGLRGPAVFLADEQQSGRGRDSRRWITPRGSSLLFSLLLRSPLAPIDLTALCSVSIVEAVEAETGLTARIKWPNDLMIGDHKVCGILTEVVGGNPRAATIVGIGLNVNMDLPSAGVPPTATSLSAELGRPCSRQALFVAMLDRIDGFLKAGLEAQPGIRRRWEELLWRRSQRVRLANGGGEVEGIVEGLAPSGALRLRVDRGAVLELATGEIVF